uniref:Uncharacterized protein n=1 Tax=uncultured prokaryote TaxID=198431 RepID=A0A0H5Q3X7_9ZZZZ|nr:hypothetical protein [uncultured prokaryote]
MDVSLNVYKSGGGHKLTVVARPAKAASLGEYVLIEGATLESLSDKPTALECLRAAYMMIGEQLASRGGSS